MNRQQIEQAVAGIVSVVLKLKIEPGRAISRENTAEWDSLKHMEIMFAIEDEFAVEFAEDELASLDSVAKLVDAIEARNAT